MKVEVIQRFQDKNTKAVHEVGAVLDITKERKTELQRFVVEVKEVKKASNKK